MAEQKDSDLSDGIFDLLIRLRTLVMQSKDLADAMYAILKSQHTNPTQRDFRIALGDWQESHPASEITEHANLWPSSIARLFEAWQLWWNAYYDAHRRLDAIANDPLIDDTSRPITDRFTFKIRRALDDCRKWFTVLTPGNASGAESIMTHLVAYIREFDNLTEWEAQMQSLVEFYPILNSIYGHLGFRKWVVQPGFDLIPTTFADSDSTIPSFEELRKLLPNLEDPAWVRAAQVKDHGDDANRRSLEAYRSPRNGGLRESDLNNFGIDSFGRIWMKDDEDNCQYYKPSLRRPERNRRREAVECDNAAVKMAQALLDQQNFQTF